MVKLPLVTLARQNRNASQRLARFSAISSHVRESLEAALETNFFSQLGHYNSYITIMYNNNSYANKEGE